MPTTQASRRNFDSSTLTPAQPRRAETRRFPKSDFWTCYKALPAPIREQADKAFDLLKADPHHPSLHFKKIGRFWSARVGLHYRAVGVAAPDGIVWFWIGTHAEYDKLIR